MLSIDLCFFQLGERKCVSNVNDYTQFQCSIVCVCGCLRALNQVFTIEDFQEKESESESKKTAFTHLILCLCIFYFLALFFLFASASIHQNKNCYNETWNENFVYLCSLCFSSFIVHFIIFAWNPFKNLFVLLFHLALFCSWSIVFSVSM